MNAVRNPRKRILLIEDSPTDQEITRRLMCKKQREVELTIAEDGEEALQMLGFPSEEDTEAEPVLPDLILLDLNMPGIDGFEILKRIRSEDRLATLPVVVLTSSNRENEVMRAYQSGCNSYIRKPFSVEEFEAVLESIQHYWFQISLLPSKEQH